MNLELKIPPPIVTIAIGALMWVIAWLLPSLTIAIPAARWLAVALVAFGVAIAVSGVVAFRRARTTINPMRPDAATSLVDGGVYRWTRNPMYLGMLCILIAWMIWLSNPLALLGPIAFVLYMNRFQIVPEERALAGRFGQQFVDYQSRVRRWL